MPLCEVDAMPLREAEELPSPPLATPLLVPLPAGLGLLRGGTTKADLEIGLLLPILWADSTGLGDVITSGIITGGMGGPEGDAGCKPSSWLNGTPKGEPDCAHRPAVVEGENKAGIPEGVVRGSIAGPGVSPRAAAGERKGCGVIG
jgi:hypothetical protein